jgi:hypothetical protein
LSIKKLREPVPGIRAADNVARRQQPTGSAVLRPVVGPQEVGTEFIEARTADLAHHQVDLAAEDADRLLDPGEPAGRGAVEGRAAEKNEIGSEAQRVFVGWVERKRNPSSLAEPNCLVALCRRSRFMERAACPATRSTGSTIRKPIRSADPTKSTNQAERFFSRMRRAEIGHYHHLAGPYLLRFAQEAAWREDHRREPNGAQVDRVVALAMRNKPSVDFCGYWQRSRAA